LKRYEQNPRKNDAVVDRMVASIDEFGFSCPILAKSSGDVIDGDLRLKACLKMGMTEVPVIPCDGWTDAQVKAFRLLVNRSVTWADWDLELLAAEFSDLKALDFDLTMTGFSQREIDSFTLQPNPAEDEAPPVPEIPVSRLGDLWICREHRVLCGDATSPDALAALCATKKVDCIWTDSPYGVKYVGKTPDRLRIQGDGEGAANLLYDALKAAEPHISERSPFYIAHPAGALYVAFGLAVNVAGWQIHQSLVWVKDSMVLGHSDYHYRHEPILYGYTPGEGRAGRGTHRGSRWYGDNAQTSVIEVPRPKRSAEHPTMKPVELIVRCVRNSCPRSAIMLDPFLGSGSTLAAAEVTDRICYGLEIDPKYVDVVVLRWQALSGHGATLDGDGRTFAEISSERNPSKS
jgi:DNA modification methylase